jgi:hypothetical protein
VRGSDAPGKRANHLLRQLGCRAKPMIVELVMRAGGDGVHSATVAGLAPIAMVLRK